MVCIVHCAISLVFFIGMIYMSFAVDKSLLTQPFVRSLTNEQLKEYQNIIQCRRRLYLEGFFLGLVLSFIYINMRRKGEKEIGWKEVCLTGTITFLTVYFYYLLSPKPQLMVVSLNCESQRKEWEKIYKTMCYHYHMGLFLGVISVIVFMKGLCKNI